MWKSFHFLLKENKMSENENPEKNKKQNRPSGILRLDITKPRRSSGGSVEFRNQPELLGEVSK